MVERGKLDKKSSDFDRQEEAQRKTNPLRSRIVWKEDETIGSILLTDQLHNSFQHRMGREATEINTVHLVIIHRVFISVLLNIVW